MKIEYEEYKPALEFKDSKECIELLEKLERESQAPIGVYVYNAINESLSCVLGSKNTFLVYYPMDYNGVGSFSSLGSGNLGEIDYWLCGHHTQAAGENLVLREILNAVITDFLENGGLSKHVKWVAD